MDGPAQDAPVADSLAPMREMTQKAVPPSPPAPAPGAQQDNAAASEAGEGAGAGGPGLRKSSGLVTDANGVVLAEHLRKSSDPRIEAISLSQARRRSVDNPFFQKTEEDLRMEQLGDMMKGGAKPALLPCALSLTPFADDLDAMYTSDQLPSVADLCDKDTDVTELKKKPSLLDTRCWCWTGAVWKGKELVLAVCAI